jgi:hypothetical protein
MIKVVEGQNCPDDPDKRFGRNRQATESSGDENSDQPDHMTNLRVRPASLPDHSVQHSCRRWALSYIRAPKESPGPAPGAFDSGVIFRRSWTR